MSFVCNFDLFLFKIFFNLVLSFSFVLVLLSILVMCLYNEEDASNVSEYCKSVLLILLYTAKCNQKTLEMKMTGSIKNFANFGRVRRRRCRRPSETGRPKKSSKRHLYLFFQQLD